MFTSELREHLVEAQNRLIDLYVQHDEASRAEDWERLRALKTEIGDAAARLEEIRTFITAPTACGAILPVDHFDTRQYTVKSRVTRGLTRLPGSEPTNATHG